MSGPVAILGLGFTTQRLARRLLQRGVPVYAAVRNPERFTEFARLGVHLSDFTAEQIPQNTTLIHSIPPLAEPDNSRIRELISELQPCRILYISSTGVYGSQKEVRADTLAAPNDENGRARVAEEQWLAAVVASSLILRSAAIYGPGRGIHMRLREGRVPRGAGGFVSRIHVDDLAAILDAGIGSPIVGTWPVADDHPAISEQVAAWCATLMGITPPQSVQKSVDKSFPVAGRRVDGKKIRELLGVDLQYPSYRTGIPAALREEMANMEARSQ
jgi:nucleoside-diphosphate-sugar epimerase